MYKDEISLFLPIFSESFHVFGDKEKAKLLINVS